MYKKYMIFSLGILVIIIIILLSIFFIKMAAKKTSAPAGKVHNWSPLKLYFLLTTLAGIIWTLVSLGILLYSVGKQILITNDEYIIADKYYEMDMCNQNVAKPTMANPNALVTPTEAEKATCKAEKRDQLIKGRSVLFKEDMLSGGIWSILFLALLLIHYPKFMAVRKEK